MATDLDLAGMGYDSGNYWYLDEPKVDEYYRAMQSVDSIEMPELPGLFLTVTTLKDRAKETSGHHTMEAFWFVPYECFERWAASDAASRPDAYLQLKQTLTDRMLRTAEKIIPGLSDHLVFCELGTPLTNDHYIPATQGDIYGTEKSMWQIGPWSYPVRTELGGLLLCGASTVSHGVMGATLSGLIAAREVLGCRVRDLLSQEGPELRIMPCDLPAGELVAADV